jgi:glycosyltransferase involved in cell wall biosynthesis
MNFLKDKSNRIIIFHTECKYLRGGEKYIYELSKRVSKQRHVVLVIETITPYWREKYNRLGIPIYLLWKPKHLYWFLLPFSLIKNAVSIRKKILPSDIIFATSFPLTFLATIISRKTVVFCFEPLSIFYDTFRIKTSSFRERAFLFIIKLFYQPLDHLAVKKAQILATLNKHVAEAIWNQYHRKPDIFIPNGVDTDFFSPSAKPIFKEKNIFFIGHSTDYTGLKTTELLLRALPFVIAKNKSLRLLVSEGIPNIPMRNHYIRLISSLGIQKYVQFVGCIPEKKLPGFYTSCDIFCYCGTPRCIGGSSASLSVIESESCGIPVLRSKGNADEIVEGKTGLYFPTENPQAVANKILQYMALSKKITHQMKLAARKHVMVHFSWDYSAKKMMQLI